MRFLLCMSLAAGVLSSAATAQTSTVPSVVVGNHVLAPGLPGQTVQIFVTNSNTGGFQIDGTDVSAAVADGGPTYGGVAGPQFPSTPPAAPGVDLITGTIFASNHGDQQNIDVFPQYYHGGITTSSGTVNANGLLATLTFDTTGIAPGIYSLKLAHFKPPLAGPSGNDTDLGVDQNFEPILPTVTNGNLIVTYPGDANFDGSVGFDDLVTLARNYGHNGATWSTGDFNNDMNVGFDDLVVLARNYGKSININPAPPSAVAAAAALSPALVPEPASVAVFALLAGMLCRRRVVACRRRDVR